MLFELLLVAIFKDGTLDSDAYVGELTYEECIIDGEIHATQWQKLDDRIRAVVANCTPLADPRVPFYEAYPQYDPKNIPVEPEQPSPHEAGKDEA